MTIALYPGTFDPVTRGHQDIAIRAAALFERLIVAVFEKPDKPVLFSAQERVAMFRKAAAHLPNVEVVAYSGLTVDFAAQVGAQVIIRGLRSGTDFENEFDMAMMNRALRPEIDIMFFVASQEYQFISSSLLKEVAQHRSKLNHLVPDHVAVALRKRYGLPV